MRTPTPEQLPAIVTLLADSGLPSEDIFEQDLSLFRIVGSDDNLDAVGGLERCGATALIRSIATAASMRGHGIAGQLVDALETLAVAEGLESLYLLTESAEGYFESKGYGPIDRSDVPASVRSSRQFSALCPDSATVMCKRLGE